MFLSQDVVIKNINCYLASKIKIKKFPSSEVGDDFSVNQGLCAGLVAYWLYLIRNDEEGFFQHRLQYLANWDLNAFNYSGQKRDEIIEQFLDNVLLLNEPSKVVATANQSNFDVSFGLVLGATQEKISRPEFSLTFIFNKAEIQKLIPTLALPNKMLRLSNAMHVIGLMFKNNSYVLYDPNCKDGPIETNDLTQIATAIFVGFSTYCKSKDYIAMNVSTYDLVGSAPAIYFDPVQYCASQLSSRQIKQESLQHKFLFFLMAKFNEYAAMDLLFNVGYKYIPWKYHVRTEMNEAVLHGNLKMLKYLLQHNIPVDHKNLPIAIEQKDDEMCYMLLAAGTAANSSVNDQKGYLDLALEHDFSAGIVLLLTAGVDLSERGRVSVQNKYGVEGAMVIFTHALQMQKSYLHIPDQFDLNDVTGEVLSDYAKHYKLAFQLGLPVDNIIVLRDKQVINQNSIIVSIQQVFNQPSFDGQFSVSEKFELESILQYFDPEMQNKKGYAKSKLAYLNTTAIQIAHSISEQAALSKSDIADAQLVLEQIIDLSFKLGIDQQNKDAENAQKIIYSYLERHHLQANHDKSNYIFFSLNEAKHQVHVEYDRDVQSLLKNFNGALRRQ